ncbi:methyltransferase [Streptomyces sp. NPDC059278]|uniref:class I SAM-dependent methyltransferase n=1 Tax=Streptomyces sp. NPDC059278 TaxID=3346801 RepID=UPI0036B1CEF8
MSNDETDEIGHLLTLHDHVAQALTVGSVAYVVPEAEAGTGGRERAESQVDEWQQVYDRLYATSHTSPFGDDFVGWNSSYDRRPIPLEQMQQWRSTTVDRIRELRPRRVLEIGVGSGLLLSQLADDCEEYWATDLSSVVVEAIARHLEGTPQLAARVHLRAQGADCVDGLPIAHFDTIVLNSVAQLFPGGDYLDTVISRALTLLAPGGVFFLGDIRNLRTHDHLHTAVALGRPTATGSDAVLRTVRKAQAREEELLVHPDYFTSLLRTTPSVTAVDVQLKRGNHHNELSRHRYDVVLHKGPAAVTDLTDCPQLPWNAAGIEDLDVLGTHLTTATLPFRVIGLPNSRLTGEAAALRTVAAGGPDAVQRGRRQLTGADSETGDAPESVDPHDVIVLAGRHGLRVVLAPAPDRPEDFEAVFTRPDAVTSGTYRPSGTTQPLAVVPAAAHRAQALAARLHTWLRERLPEHSLPDAVVAVDALPVPEGAA